MLNYLENFKENLKNVVYPKRKIIVNYPKINYINKPIIPKYPSNCKPVFPKINPINFPSGDKNDKPNYLIFIVLTIIIGYLITNDKSNKN